MEQNKQVDMDEYLNKLAGIYWDNCGMSIGYRTIAHDLATNYIINQYAIAYDDAVDIFSKILDDIDIVHREYDITFFRDEKKYEELKQEFKYCYNI